MSLLTRTHPAGPGLHPCDLIQPKLPSKDAISKYSHPGSWGLKIGIWVEMPFGPQGCCNKSLLTWWLKQHRFTTLQFSRLEVNLDCMRLKSKCWQGSLPEATGKNLYPASFPTSTGCLHFLVCGPTFHLPSPSQGPLLLPFCLL